MQIDNLMIDFTGAGGNWKHALNFTNSKEIVLDKVSTRNGKNVHLTAQTGIQHSTVRFINQIPETGIEPVKAGKNAIVTYSNMQ